MESQVSYLGGVQFSVTARGHTIISDQPKDNGGTDAGMTPPELLLAALGSCAGYYAAEYLMVRSLPTTGLRVQVLAEKALRPARLGSFQIHVEAPSVGPEHREMLLRTVKHCLVHNTLVLPPSIDVTVETSRQSQAA